MISSTQRTAGPYAGTGLQTVFSFAFKVFLTTDVLVVQTDPYGNVTDLTLTAQYSVTLNSNQDTSPGGTITMVTAPAAGYTITISSQVQALQGLNLANAGNFYPTSVDNALDLLTILIQQLDTQMSDALKLPIGDPASSSIPAVTNRSNNLLGFDSNGNVIAVTPTAGTASALSMALAAKSGSSLLTYNQGGTGAVNITQQAKNQQQVCVNDFGALGNGSNNDTTAFVNATAIGVPVYVPYTGSFYVVTSLTNPQIELLWGPGIVQVAGVQIQLQSSPVVQNSGGTIPNTGGAVISGVRNALTPANQLGSIPGNVGSGMISTIATRTGGVGLYGNWLSTLTVSAATPSPQFDNGITSWATHQNLTGGAIYGMWPGANTPSKALGQTFSGGSAIGMEVNVGNRWADFGAQTDIGGTRYTVGIQVVPDVLPTVDGLNTYTVSGITVATPAVITTTVAHSLTAGSTVTLGGTGTVPTGLNIGYYYYVLAAGLTATSFQVSSTANGAAIATTGGSFSGSVTILPNLPGSFAFGILPSVHGHSWWVGNFLRAGALMPDNGQAWPAGNSYGMLHNGATTAAAAPRAWSFVTNYWTNGLDFSSATFSGAALNFSFANQTATTATAGSVASPGNFQGYIKVAVSGTIVKIPYFQN